MILYWGEVGVVVGGVLGEGKVEGGREGEVGLLEKRERVRVYRLY